MRRLIKIARRACGAGIAALGAGTLAQALFSTPVQAQTAVDCSTLTNPIYVKGSSAVQPFLAGIAAGLNGLATPYTIVYQPSGSCIGVEEALNGTQPLNGTAIYWTGTGSTVTQTSCAADNISADIGVSDVFSTSCAGFESTPLTGIGDFYGPIQIMTFVVPAASNQNSISAEAAYLTFGLGDAGQTNWDDPTLYSVRNAGSGTQSMISKAIGVPPTAWKGTDRGGSGGVVTAISSPTGDPDKTIGIVSTGEADPNRARLRILAYQHKGQHCAYWPDSTLSAVDKESVRDGHYPIWGPLHLYADVDSQGEPTSAAAKTLIDIMTFKETVPGVNVVDIAINTYLVPTCAMRVTRSGELGDVSPYTPDAPCGCYFDSKRKTGGTDCEPCVDNTDCSAVAPHCSFGYCEVN